MIRQPVLMAAFFGLFIVGHLPAAGEPTRHSDTGCFSSGLNMKYEAYIAGVNAGEANLRVIRDGGGYRVEGTARSKGLWESLQQWRAEYWVEGELSSGAGKQASPSPGHFYSLQTTPNKRREIHIEDGVLNETKNHKVRDPRPAQTGYDLLSALFFLPACEVKARIHTGRDGYEFTRVEQAAGLRECNYLVMGEDGEQFELTLDYRQLDKVTVPAIIAVRGPLPGRMVLVDSAPVKSPVDC